MCISSFTAFKTDTESTLEGSFYPIKPPTQGVDEADPKHVEGEQRVVDVLSPDVIHEDVIDHRAHGGAEAGQVVDHADPGALHLHPWDTERQQHQEKKERDACRESRRRIDVIGNLHMGCGSLMVYQPQMETITHVV